MWKSVNVALCFSWRIYSTYLLLYLVALFLTLIVWILVMLKNKVDWISKVIKAHLGWFFILKILFLIIICDQSLRSEEEIHRLFDKFLYFDNGYAFDLNAPAESVYLLRTLVEVLSIILANLLWKNRDCRALHICNWSLM